MRSLFLLSACLLPALAFAQETPPTPPPAPDVTLTMTAQEQQTWTQVGPILDACVGAAAMRSDLANCKTISQFLAAYAAKVAAAKPAQ